MNLGFPIAAIRDQQLSTQRGLSTMDLGFSKAAARDPQESTHC
jgi:hypothetical protein